MFDPDQFHDPEFRTLVLAARAVIAERVHRGVATPPERLAVAAVDEMPDEDDPAEVRAWGPAGDQEIGRPGGGTGHRLQQAGSIQEPGRGLSSRRLVQ